MKDSLSKVFEQNVLVNSELLIMMHNLQNKSTKKLHDDFELILLGHLTDKMCLKLILEFHTQYSNLELPKKRARPDQIIVCD